MRELSQIEMLDYYLSGEFHMIEICIRRDTDINTSFKTMESFIPDWRFSDWIFGVNKRMFLFAWGKDSED